MMPLMPRAGKLTYRLKNYFFALVLTGCCFGFFACPAETRIDNDASTLPLAGPRSVQVTAKDGFLVLQWTKSAPAQGIVPYYEVYISNSANSGSASKWGTVYSDNSQLVIAVLENLQNDITYYVWVKAVYGGLGISSFSPTSYGMPIPVPASPGIVTVYPGELMLELRWDPVNYAFSYEVYYVSENLSDTTPPAETPMLPVSEAGAVIPGLTNGIYYTVWIRAKNTAGESGYSKKSGTPQAAGSIPAGAPGNLKAEPGDEKLTLTWDQVSGVPWYKVYYGNTNSFSAATEYPDKIPATAPGVQFSLTGLGNGTKYYVWVQSWNSQCTSRNETISSAASGTPEAKAPVVWTNFQFYLGRAKAEYIFAQDLPPSAFFPEGRPYTDRLTRIQETTLGNLFADAVDWYVRKHYPSENIDFVFINGGYIDNVLSAGNISVGTIASIVQPGARNDKIMFLTLTGPELKSFLNDVADVVHTGRGSSGTGNFGIVSKEIRYTIKYPVPPLTWTEEISWEHSEPYYHGSIKPGTLQILRGSTYVDLDAEIASNPNGTYRICTTDYNASGVYFTNLFTAGTNKNLTSVPFWYGVAEYIYDQGTITPYLDGRIKIEGGVPLPYPWVTGN